MIKLLDHGSVLLVDTMPHGEGEGDQRIVDAARVSYAAGTTKKRSDAGLIQYLIRNHHTTPLEQVIFTWRVKAPISVARQWFRHRTWSMNETSTRYSEVVDGEVYIPDVTRMRVQDTKNRQGSGDVEIDQSIRAISMMKAASSRSYRIYEQLLGLGLAREVARGVLPLDTYTEFYGTIDLHNLMGFLRLRLDPHAQWEIRQYAQAMLTLATPTAPVAFAAWAEEWGTKEEAEA